MKVGLISFHSFFRPGGVKNHILGLAQEFKKRGIETKIIAPRRKGSEDYGQDVILLGTSFPLSFSGSKSDLSINFNPLAVEKVLKREKFDVLHFHNVGFPSTLQILESSKSLNILTLHSNIDGNRFFAKLPKIFYPFEKLICRKIGGIIGVSSVSLEFLKNYSGPKTIIPNGIDVELFNPRAPRIEGFGETGILFVGRIEKRKGLIYLLKAHKLLSKKHPGLRLIIVGEGELKKDCQNWAAENNLKEVYFKGEISEEERPSYFASADIFVSPAVFGESFGLVLLEAMASGTPLVGFANRGYQELLKGKRGADFLVPPKDYQALARKIDVLIENKSLRQEVAEWGVAEAQNYSWSKVADKILNFYQLCQKKKS